MKRPWTAACGVLLALFASPRPSDVRAEHRVALLIDGRAGGDETAPRSKSLRDAAEGLRIYGFRCESLKGAGDTELESAIERFSRTTPTRGTALIYYRGPVRAGGAKSTTGFAPDRVLESLSRHGGSSLNLLVVDVRDDGTARVSRVTQAVAAVRTEELPPQCLLAFGDLVNLGGSGGLMEDIRAGAEVVLSSLPPGVELIGRGSRVISPPDRFTRGSAAGDEWVDAQGMVFCWCPPGRYVKGSPPGEAGRYPDETRRDVLIREGFWVSKYEVTLGQWRGARPRATVARHKNHPINMISQSKDTLRRELHPLTRTERKSGRLPEDWEYSLPTEDQWEYAARAGTTTTWYFGDDETRLPQHANFGDKSYYDTGEIYSNAAHRTLDDGDAGLAIVGRHRANPWGLHDVYGNVAEWCHDAVIRGGSWLSVAASCRSAYRHRISDRDKRTYVGARFVIRRTPRTSGPESRK